MVMALVVGYIISHHGWSDAYFALSVPVFLLVVPFLAIFLRGKPAEIVRPQVVASSETLPDHRMAETIRNRAFWMLALAQILWGLSAGALIHIVAYLTSIGYTLQSATTGFATIAGLAAAGKPAFGAIGDRIGGKNALAIALLLIAASHILVLNVRHGWLLILYLLVVGFAVASPVALAPLVLAESLGLTRFGTLYGWIQLASTLGLFAGPLIAGELYDLTHSYVTSFETAALIALSGAVASFLCTAPRRAGLALSSAVHGITE